MKFIGIYHQIDREILDIVADLHSKGCPRDEIRKEAIVLHSMMGIGPKTSEKRSRPAFKAWVSNPTNTSRYATELYPSCKDEERLALHVAMLYRSYPFFVDVMSTIGSQIQLGGRVNQGIIRNRILRSYGQGENARQAVQKVIQSLVSWGILHRTKTSGEYSFSEPFLISFEICEVLLSGFIEGSEIDAIAITEINKMPAMFPWKMCDIRSGKLNLLNTFIEGIGNEFVAIDNLTG